MVTLRAILEVDAVKQLDPEKVEIWVNREPVWDYKDLDGKLMFIHEKSKGSEKYSKVMLKELLEYQDLPIYSETLGKDTENVALLAVGKTSVRNVLNFTEEKTNVTDSKAV